MRISFSTSRISTSVCSCRNGESSLSLTQPTNFNIKKKAAVLCTHFIEKCIKEQGIFGWWLYKVQNFRNTIQNIVQLKQHLCACQMFLMHNKWVTTITGDRLSIPAKCTICGKFYIVIQSRPSLREKNYCAENTLIFSVSFQLKATKLLVLLLTYLTYARGAKYGEPLISEINWI